MISLDKNIYINKEYKIENDRILSTANRFIHNYYGQFLYTDKIVNSNFSLNASLPYEVLDDGKRKLRFGNYKNIAEINFETNNKVIKFSGLNRKNIEKIIVETILCLNK